MKFSHKKVEPYFVEVLILYYKTKKETGSRQTVLLQASDSAICIDVICCYSTRMTRINAES